MAKGTLFVTSMDTLDVRFPTSRTLDGSDAMNPDPDYSAPYVILRTEDPKLSGHGFAFTIGPGTEVAVAAIEALRPHIVGRDAMELFADMGAFYRGLTGISQFRWLGPEKGIMHMAIGALLNAVWDLFAKSRGVPLWQLLVQFTPAEIIQLIDFRYIVDVIGPDVSMRILESRAPEKNERAREVAEVGLPAYTTSAGWLGYDDDKIRRLTREAIADGFTHIKLKVGRNLEEDVRRCRIVRDEIGPERYLMVDANQVWSVPEAIEWMGHLAEFRPLWIEEPTSPDDILGHAAIARAVAPIGVASGEHIHNRVMFKQFFQAEALSFCQIDACRVASVNEVVAILLLAAHYGVPVCPHAGGVGLCELVVHLAAFDAIALAGDNPERVVEYVDHLHEHFAEPSLVENGRYRLPQRPGYAEILPESLERFRYPDGAAWTEDAGVPA
jgi:L-fuconate dehydratase